MTACYFTLQDVIGHEWLWENKEEIRIGGDPEDLDKDVIGAVTFHQINAVQLYVLHTGVSEDVYITFPFNIYFSL